MSRTNDQWREFLVTNFSTNGVAYDILKDWEEERATLLEALKPLAKFANAVKGKKPDELILGYTRWADTPQEVHCELRVKDMFAARDALLVVGEKKDA